MKRIISVITVLALALCILSACSESTSAYALKIGDRVITAEQYKATAMSIKSEFFTENGIEETGDVWTQFVDESYSKTLQEYLDAMVQSYIIEYNLYSEQFDRLGLTLTDSAQKKIDSTLESYITRYGSEEALDDALKEQGFSYESFKEQYYNDAKKNAVIMYYFGPNGKEAQVDNDEIMKYYSEYYTKVKHVFLSTKDSNEADMKKEERDKIGKKAENIYEKAKNGADFDALIKEYNEDPGMASSPDGYVFSSDDTSYTQMFHDAAFDMEPGEIRLLQTNLGYHIMKKYPFDKSELENEDTISGLIENMMGTESTKLVDRLKEEIGVEYNNSVLASLSVARLEKVTSESEENVLDYNMIKDIADETESK